MKRLLTLLTLALIATTAAAQPRRTRPAAQPPARPQPTPARTNPTGAASPAATSPTTNNAGALPGVLAVVNGVRITSAELSSETEQQVRGLERQVAEARRTELDRQINSILLDAEAKRRGTTTLKILEEEVTAKTPQPTEAEAQTMFEQNKTQIQAQFGRPVEFKEVKDDIIATIRDERQQAQAKQLAARLRSGAQYQVLVTEVTPPTNAADRARVLATVNGQSITAGDVEDMLRPFVAQVAERSYKLRQQELDQRINDVLLQQEAQRRQVTPKALLETEVGARLKPVTEAEALAFYNENKARIDGEFAQLKNEVMQYLSEQRQHEATGTYADQLRRTAKIETFLQPPVPPVFNIATDDQPTRGSQTAKVTIVEFTDFQCPSCAAAQPVLERLLTEYGDRVRLVVRDFPLSQHKNAQKAAEAAEAARAQGKYWEYATLLFKNQAAATTPELKEATLTVAKLKDYATELGLNRQQFDAALDSGRFADKIQRDRLDAQKIGVNHTPSIYINGRLTADNNYETLKATLDAALRGGSGSTAK